MLEDIATFSASTDFGRPTNKVVTIPGKTTTSLKGISGRSDFISLIEFILGQLNKYQLPDEVFLGFVFSSFIGSVFDVNYDFFKLIIWQAKHCFHQKLFHD